MSGSGESEHDADTSPVIARNRSAEIVVALLFLGVAAIFIYDSLRLGFGWIEGQGPAAGYFPFYIAMVMAISSVITLLRSVVGLEAGIGKVFTTTRAFGRVLTVLLPALIYVLMIGGLSIGPVEVPGLGIYVASAIFICFFMVAFGGEGIVRAVLVALGVPLFFFFIFERWFLVPLPKGPLEVFLGYA